MEPLHKQFPASWAKQMRANAIHLGIVPSIFTSRASRAASPLLQTLPKGTTGRLCSKCLCEETGSSCMFRSNGRCVTCESTRVSIAIVTSIAGFLFLCLILVIIISCRFPKAWRRLKAICAQIVNAGSLKVKILLGGVSACISMKSHDLFYADFFDFHTNVRIDEFHVAPLGLFEWDEPVQYQQCAGDGVGSRLLHPGTRRPCKRPPLHPSPRTGTYADSPRLPLSGSLPPSISTNRRHDINLLEMVYKYGILCCAC